MSCKVTYQGKQFDSEEELLKYFETQGPTVYNTDESSYFNTGETSADQAATFAERWGLSFVNKYGVKGFAPKGGKATRTLVGAIQEQLKKSGHLYDKITPVYDATSGLINFRNENGTIMFQEVPYTEASAETISKMKGLLTTMGVDINSVGEIRDAEGNLLNANAKASLLENVIDVVYGKESQTITEEAMHFVVDILQKKNPALFNEMLNRISKYEIYTNVLNNPFYRKQYVNKDGTIDIRAMKIEAIGKLLAEHVINQNEGTTEEPALLKQKQTWWESIVDFFKGLFNKAGYNPFEQAAAKIVEGTLITEKRESLEDLANQVKQKSPPGIFGDVFNRAYDDADFGGALDIFRQQLSDPATYQTVIDQMLGGDKELADKILSIFDASNAELFQAANPQGGTVGDRIFAKIKEEHSKLSKIIDKDGNSKYVREGKEVKRRVTDMTHEFYDKTFKAGNIDKTEAEIANNDLKKDKGTAGHSDIENLIKRYVDPQTGFIRDTPLRADPSVMSDNPKILKKLDFFVKNLIEQYAATPGVRILTEQQIFDASKTGGQAGTIDFMAIFPDGTIDIRDWKFMDLSKTANDVPWYKKDAFNIQIGEYKNMLKKNYGVTKFGKTRAIPINTIYGWNNPVTKDKLVLKDVMLGSADVNRITDLKLLPVPTQDETTGSKKLDELIGKLNALYKKLTKEKVQEGRKDIKRAKLQDLERAIRTLQVQGKVDDLLKSATSIVLAVQGNINSYNELIKTGKILSPKEKNDLAGKLLEEYDVVELYTELPKYFRDVELDPAIKKKMEDLATTADKTLDHMKELRGEVGEIIANGYGIKDLLNPERIVGFLAKNFRSLSSAQTKATRVLWKMVEKISAAVNLEYDQAINELEKHKTALTEAAKKSGTNVNALLKKLLQYDKDGRWTGQLIRKIDPKFHTQLTQALKDGDKKWILANIDVAKYTEWYGNKLRDQAAYENGQTYVMDDDQANTAEQIRRVEKFKKLYALENVNPANDQVRRFPKEEQWLSNEYKEIKKTPELLAFYEYWQKQMLTSMQSGMLADKAYTRFVPNVKKTFLEKQFDGVKNGDKKKHLNIFNHLLADNMDDVVRDEFTGRPVDKITAHYVYDIGERMVDKKGQEYIDYSRKSDDLFKIMAVWNEEMLKFKYRTEVENEAHLLGQIERDKQSVTINKKTKVAALNQNNDKNADYFDNYMNSILYGRRYTDKGDATFKVNINSKIDAVNGFFKKIGGFEPIPRAQEDELEISGTKLIEAANRWFQMKTLGFNLVSGLSNLVGGTANAYINAGRWFTKQELAANEMRLASSKFSTKDGQIAEGLVEYFLPLTDDEKREKARSVSTKGFVSNMSADWLFYLQRKSDRFVQLPIFWSYAQNTMVENGQLVNIREYVREQNDYANFYKLSPTERTALQEKMEKEIQALKDDRSLFKISTMKDGHLVIPGIERNSDAVYAFRNKVQQFSKDVLGNMDQNDIYQYRMNILLKSMMMFKNWIPRMVDVRFGGLRYEVGKDEWEWGRINMAFTALFSNLLDSTKLCIGMNSGKESLIERAKEIYIQKAAEHAEDGFMTEAQFVDLYVRGNQQVIREMLLTLSLLTIFLSVKAAVPPDDPQAKGVHNWATRASNKFFNELAFFYNPISMTQMANGNIFPALGTLVDLERFATNGLQATGYAIIGDKEGLKKTKTAKHLFNAIPVTKEFVKYLAIFNHDIGTEMGVKVSTQSGNY